MLSRVSEDSCCCKFGESRSRIGTLRCGFDRVWHGGGRSSLLSQRPTGMHSDDSSVFLVRILWRRSVGYQWSFTQHARLTARSREVRPRNGSMCGVDSESEPACRTVVCCVDSRLLRLRSECRFQSFDPASSDRKYRSVRFVVLGFHERSSKSGSTLRLLQEVRQRKWR